MMKIPDFPMKFFQSNQIFWFGQVFQTRDNPDKGSLWALNIRSILWLIY